MARRRRRLCARAALLAAALCPPAARAAAAAGGGACPIRGARPEEGACPVAPAALAPSLLQAGQSRARAEAPAPGRGRPPPGGGTAAAQPRQAAADGDGRSGEGERLLPLVWLHVPKTGWSFATTIAHYGCPRIPSGELVTHPGLFEKRYPFQQWCNGSFGYFEAAHEPLRMPFGGDGSALGHVVSMFRRPVARTISGYFHHFHDCQRMQKKYGCAGYDSGCPEALFMEPVASQAPRVREYAECVQECTARMLTGSGCAGATWGRVPEKPLSPVLVDAALQRVPRLGFVGLTEHWPLSMCLFHLRFGGHCHSVSFLNLHPMDQEHRTGNWTADDWHSMESELEQQVDLDLSVEDSIYRAAADRFWEEVRAYGATGARCREVCPEGSDHFAD